MEYYTDEDIRCSNDRRRKWKKNDNKKNVIKANMPRMIDSQTKDRLATFRNAEKAFMDGYIMLLYVNNTQSILFTRKSIWQHTVKILLTKGILTE